MILNNNKVSFETFKLQPKYQIIFFKLKYHLILNNKVPIGINNKISFSIK